MNRTDAQAKAFEMIAEAQQANARNMDRAAGVLGISTYDTVTVVRLAGERYDVADNGTATPVGCVRGDVFEKTVTGSKHFLRVPTPALGFPVVRGHGRQVALSLDRYSVNGEPPTAERRAAASNQERKELQLGLFAGGD